MLIRKAEVRDIPRINDLLYQVARIHHNGRPDIFKDGGKKYTDNELEGILADDETPVFVAEKDGYVCGYIFCIYEYTKGSDLLCDMKTMYIDDLCTDEKYRGMHVGSELYEYATAVAKESGCYRITLNVWSFNESAEKFYQRKGLSPLKTVMEYVL